MKKGYLKIKGLDMTNFDTYIFDVDDCLYPIDCGLHESIKKRICQHANATPSIRNMAKEWLGKDRDIMESDLGILFPLIVMQYQKSSPDDLENYFDLVYGQDYDLIKKDTDLVAAIQTLKAKGKDIYIYTNGPSSIDPSRDSHVQKVLKSLGFDDSFVQDMRNKTYDLKMSVNAGVGKSTNQGFKNMLSHFNIQSKKAVFLDDGVKNLLPAKHFGLSAVWTWTTTKKPKQSEQDLANDNDIPCVRKTASFFKPLDAPRKTNHKPRSPKT